MPYLYYSAWYAHSEMILQTLVCSEDRMEREFAVQCIKGIRGVNEYGNISVRPRRTPRLNQAATCLQELISWDQASEPVLTCEVATSDLGGFEDCPMSVPHFSVHGQSVERCVKQVTLAAKTVYGQDKRDGFIRTGYRHRQLLPVLRSKKDVASMAGHI